MLAVESCFLVSAVWVVLESGSLVEVCISAVYASGAEVIGSSPVLDVDVVVIDVSDVSIV